MPLQLTALYAAILALIILALGINVTVHRIKIQVSLGDGGKPQMRRMIRLPGNANEYLLLALILDGALRTQRRHPLGTARHRHRAGGGPSDLTWAMWGNDPRRCPDAA